jgi:FkbM family methyltransferase
MSYLDAQFIENIPKNDIEIIFEVGSRDLLDARNLFRYFHVNNPKIYAFECNPDCLVECMKNRENFDREEQDHIFLVENAVSLTNDQISFYPFDLSKHDNMGASSMFVHKEDGIQKQISVNGIRLDTFMETNNIQNIDLLCMDLQGYELNALKSLGTNISRVKYIITECAINSAYKGGVEFIELYDYLSKFNFKYVSSNAFGHHFPDTTIKRFCEFDSLFVNNSNHS